MIKNMIRTLIIISLLLASVAVTGEARAWSGCGSYYTVQWGDTLYGIAVRCGTTMAAIRALNPGLGSWVYAGQVLVMPGAVSYPSGAYQIHVVQRGETLKMIAARYGVTMYAIANLNGIYNYNLIFVGQRLKIPSDIYVPPAPIPAPAPYYGSTYIVRPGDTLRILAYRWGVTIYQILAANPQIINANLIYVGQVINIPGTGGNPGSSTGTSTGTSSATYYTVQPGDTLKIIANMYGTTVYNLQLLNPQIWNPNWIYVGMVIRVS